MSKKVTTKELIDRFKIVHGDDYDYKLVEYTGYGNKVKIICHIHGIFEQSPGSHLSGSGCPNCAKNRTLTTKEVISRFKLVHGDTYGYELVEYINAITKISIICLIHGVFVQKPGDHHRGHGCPKCGGTAKCTQEEFILQANNIHNDMYDYSLVEYINIKSKVIIICPFHGKFEQAPITHLQGSGCPKCPKSSWNLLEYYKHNPKGQELGHYYQLRLFNETESFYKRGITRNSIKERFTKNNLPYEYEIIDDLVMTNLETTEQEEFDEIKYEHLSYKPNIKFGGYKECYTEKIVMKMDYNMK